MKKNENGSSSVSNDASYKDYGRRFDYGTVDKGLKIFIKWEFNSVSGEREFYNKFTSYFAFDICHDYVISLFGELQRKISYPVTTIGLYGANDVLQKLKEIYSRIAIEVSRYIEHPDKYQVINDYLRGYSDTLNGWLRQISYNNINVEVFCVGCKDRIDGYCSAGFIADEINKIINHNKCVQQTFSQSQIPSPYGPVNVANLYGVNGHQYQPLETDKKVRASEVLENMRYRLIVEGKDRYVGDEGRISIENMIRKQIF